MTSCSPGSDPDVVVIGAGPNGLTAAAILGQAGLRVLVLEANQTAGGAVRTAEVTRPGFKHDLFSGFYPLFPMGPIGQLPLARFGLEWCNFGRSFAGGTPGGPGVAVYPRLAESIRSFERVCPGDGAGYERLWRLWRLGGRAVLDLLFNPIGSPAPLLSARKLGSFRRMLDLAQLSVSGAENAAQRYLQGEDARVLFTLSPLHSDLGPAEAGGGLYGLVMLGLAQQVGMPVARGGAQSISNALVRLIESQGGQVLTNRRVSKIVVRRGRAEAVLAGDMEVRPRKAVLATLPPTHLCGRLIEPELLPQAFMRAVRQFRWGSGVFKLDIALCRLPGLTSHNLNGAGVLHLARSCSEARRATDQVHEGLLPQAPFIIAGFHTLADPTRAPAGCHTLWVETHVPSRPTGDAADRLTGYHWSSLRQPFAERLIDELGVFAPDIRSCVLDYHAQTPEDLEAADTNLVGGDVAGGSFTIDQQLVFRPVSGWFRHRMPIKGLYLGGASAHPGGGVHGGAGANAARVLLQDLKLQAVQESVEAGVRRSARWLRDH